MQIESHWQVIGGTVYDTATAELIGWVHDHNIIDSDYEGIKRHLMRRADGRFFLFTLFGTMSKRPIGQIVPMAELDAMRWCELNGVGTERVAVTFSGDAIEIDGIAA